MDKQTKHKNKILKFIPKALSFQNPPFSPTRDKDVTATRPGGRAFSGPIVSIIPKEAWRRTKSEMADTPQEPTSPKVSCLGQIKHRHKKKMMIKKEKDVKRSRVPSKEAAPEKKEKMLSGAEEAKAPALGQMKRFASSRSSLSNFDWTAQVAPEDSYQRRNCHSNEEREKEVRIPFSAPLMVGGGGREMQLQPKKEINLWKRRTMAPPRILKLSD